MYSILPCIVGTGMVSLLASMVGFEGDKYGKYVLSAVIV